MKFLLEKTCTCRELIHSSQIKSSPLTTKYFMLLYAHLYRDTSKAHLEVQHGLISTGCFLLWACFFLQPAIVFPPLFLILFVLYNLPQLLVFKVFSRSIPPMPFSFEHQQSSPLDVCIQLEYSILILVLPPLSPCTGLWCFLPISFSISYSKHPS